MTSSEVRQSFLDFFAAKGHAIVPSASLMPSSPNLLFTNAGMNQFVPYFLGDRQAPWPRAADTQKCIRAGGKHNDLDDVGFDTYHHTFFEMLGNWSFGDYFKAEALAWSWELLTRVWGLPKERLYVSVYKPGPNDPASFDQEAYEVWSGLLSRDGLDPKVHIKFGGKKDNFWMMGETGPCGPCSEMHIDLTPENATGGSLVNTGSPWCIELWNDVFIQFNAEEDGTFSPLKAKHVDTGMGFERVAGIFATTRGFTDFSRPPSNYNADVFTPIFDRISALCGKRYGATLPANPQNCTAEEMRDVVFRVLADHARCLSCGIADGILPGNEGRNYVLRRILRRAVMYGRRLDLKPGFFVQLVEPVVQTLGGVFPELKERRSVIEKVIASEESAFDRTIDRGMAEFGRLTASGSKRQVSGAEAFTLYDTYGFPLDLTQILAQERGLPVDTAGFEAEMEKQRERARAAQKKEVITVSEGGDSGAKTTFVGYDPLAWRGHRTRVVETLTSGDKTFVVLASTPFYGEMGGQVGDYGTLETGGQCVPVLDTQRDASGRVLHRVEGSPALPAGTEVTVNVDLPRRLQIQRHHTATHILHWALRSVLGTHVRQAGSYVGPERLRFDFAHFEAISHAQLAEIERLCNEKVLSNDPVVWYEVKFDEKPADTIAFFGEKYGDVVRVVDIGSDALVEPDGGSFRLQRRTKAGFSAELCGGTHVQATGEIGLIKIVSESAIAAGTRRVEAVAGEAALELVRARFATVEALAEDFRVKPEELRERIAKERAHGAELERELKQLKAQAAQAQAASLSGSVRSVRGLQVLATVLSAPNPNELRDQALQVFKKLENGLLVAGCVVDGKGTVLAMSSDAAQAAGYKAGDIIRELAGQLGGKGGGKPDFAMGGGPNGADLDRVLKTWEAAVQ